MIQSTGMLRPNDVLSEVLALVRLRGAIVCSAELTSPWGLRFQGWDDTAFYLVVRGSCSVDVRGTQKAIALAAGDLLLLAPGRAHVIRDAPRSPAVAFETLRAFVDESTGVLRHGKGGSPTTLVCGCFELDGSGVELLTSVFPPVVHVRRETATPGVLRTIEALASEVTGREAGAHAVLARLVDVLLIQILRLMIAQHLVELGWLRALDHAPLARALAAIHQAPAEPWTLDSLANCAGMSRSVFASRFRSVVGQTPIGYLTRWRMHRAALLLEHGTMSAGAVGAEVGYGSDESFSRAFKEWAGVTPGAYRRGRRRVQS